MSDNEKSAFLKKTTPPTGTRSCPLVLKIYLNPKLQIKIFPKLWLVWSWKYHLWAINSPSQANTIPFSSFLQQQCWPDLHRLSVIFRSPPRSATKCLKSYIEKHLWEQAILYQERQPTPVVVKEAFLSKGNTCFCRGATLFTPPHLHNSHSRQSVNIVLQRLVRSLEVHCLFFA